MKMTFCLGLLLTVFIGLPLPGCDVGTNPLIFDGTTKGKLRVDDTTGIVLISDSINLSEIRNAVSDDIDSVHFFNLTVLIDSTDGTPTGTTITTGLLRILSGTNVDTIATMTNVSLTEFSTPRSIFDTTITGWQYNTRGVTFLIKSLQSQNPPTMIFQFGAIASQRPLHFTVTAKVYAQVYTKPSK